MTSGLVIDLVRQLLEIACMVAGPLLVGGLIVGVAMGIVQAATSIQEASLTFLPKLLLACGFVGFGGPWALDRLVGFAVAMFEEVALLGPHAAGG